MWGLDGAERLARSVRRAGIDPERSDTGPGSVLIRSDFLYDEPIIKALVKRPDAALVFENGTGSKTVVAAHFSGPVPASAESDLDAAARDAQLRLMTPTELVGEGDTMLRKRARPYLMPLDGTPRSDLERASFSGAYKGATDFVTKFVWPWPARHVTRWCAMAGIRPNMITFVSLLLVILTFWLFWTDQFGLGIVTAWAMCFLDTVDGKLARVTLTSTRFGEIFDHGIDLIHPPFWYWAWFVGLSTVAVSPETQQWLEPALWVVLVGYVLGRIEEAIFLSNFKMQIHIWRPVDHWFRTVTARRNPNLAILMVATILGFPAEGLIGVAVWTVFSLAFHLVRLLQAFAMRARGEPIRSWLTETE